MKKCIYIPFLSCLLCQLVFGRSFKDTSQCNFDKICADSILKDGEVSEFDLLPCILNEKFSELNLTCKRNALDLARNFFENKNLRHLFQSCQEDLNNIECKQEKLIFCILDQKEKLSDPYCGNIVVRLDRLIHTHFSLISDYIKSCKYDMEHLCGYRQEDFLKQFLEEDELLDCLQKNIDFIKNPSCQHDILRISEIQGESISLDSHLFELCAGEQRNFCQHLPSKPSSAVLIKCLQDFINHPSFTSKCRDEIITKERLASKDIRVSKGLMRDCREDIRKNRCRRLISDDKTVRLAQMLLCLENAVHNGTEVSIDCRSEMIRHRRLLLEDYSLSPEVLTGCSLDVSKFCEGVEKGGKTIHCLLENSRSRRNKDNIVSAPCQRSLEELLKTVDAGQDWKVDPVIHSSCESAVRNLCDEARGDDTKVMSCLMDNINSNTEYMSSECAKALLQVQYFISRDFKLDSQLFDACRDDAITFCHAKHVWNDDHSMDVERGPLILPCLYRYVYGINADHSAERIKLKLSCEKQVRRVMRQRAVRAELIPEVEVSCLEDLSKYCTDKVGPGEEMLCLQDKYSSLKLKCRYVVGNFTEAEASDINLNPIVKMYCKPVINEFCKDEMHRLKNDSNDVMSCLIKHKNDEEMKLHYKCRAAVEHFQLISLNDYHFTVTFKNACRPYVLHYCPKAHTKAQVVECLSEVTQNDTLKDERYKLSRECRYQLRAQLLQQREFIDLDPKLKSACENNIRNLCKKDNHNAEILECLEENLSRLETQCQKVVFQIEQHDFRDSSTDYTLLNSCKEMIKAYCKGDITQALVCLKRFKDEPLFDNNCRSVVLKRMVEQSVDYRLNPALQRSCNQDIRKFCFSLLKNHIPETEFEGKILNCLKIKFRERKLRKECETQLVTILKDSALNYKLNPLLRNLCSEEIQTICGNEVALEKTNNSGQVEECLKVAFSDGRITNRACRLEVAGLIEEAKADIHVDPLLHRACALDVTKYCIDVPPGAGRILQCLQNVMASKKNLLQSNCKLKLSQRMEMFKNAEISKNQEMNNIGELVYHLKQSPSRKYFTVVLLSFVGIVFMMGLYCGRVSRKYTTLKNK